MDKSKIADKEIEIATWMRKKGYDRRASKDIAPIIVEYLREFKLLNLHIVSNNEGLESREGVAVCTNKSVGTFCLMKEERGCDICGYYKVQTDC